MCVCVCVCVLTSIHDGICTRIVNFVEFDWQVIMQWLRLGFKSLKCTNIFRINTAIEVVLIFGYFILSINRLISFRRALIICFILHNHLQSLFIFQPIHIAVACIFNLSSNSCHFIFCMFLRSNTTCIKPEQFLLRKDSLFQIVFYIYFLYKFAVVSCFFVVVFLIKDLISSEIFGDALFQGLHINEYTDTFKNNKWILLKPV